MNTDSPIDVVFGRALRRMLEIELTATHDAMFTAAFFEDHQASVSRAVRRRINGRSAIEVAYELRMMSVCTDNSVVISDV